MNKHSLPMVSVVVPMFNVEQYIEQCINSVLSQTYKNFELICVNDGCTDQTLNVLSQFCDGRIKIIHQKNQGLSAARNSGIAAAKGIYVALLDSDDYWDKEKLTLHLNHLNQNPEVGISFCPSIFVDEEGQNLGIGQYPKLRNLTSKHIFCRNPIGNGSVPVIRRCLLNEIAFKHKKTGRTCYFDEDLKQSEDIELWLRIALLNKWSFEGISKALTFYRINNGGLSANLEKQYDNWCLAVRKNTSGNELFFNQYLTLARAYQMRYLARRAVKSGDGVTAIKLTCKALMINPKIAVEEPARTSCTVICSLLSLLPSHIYRYIEESAIGLVRQQKTIR
jgi:glycosyltransferase involved in cell wall biosynthesis